MECPQQGSTLKLHIHLFRIFRWQHGQRNMFKVQIFSCYSCLVFRVLKSSFHRCVPECIAHSILRAPGVDSEVIFLGSKFGLWRAYGGTEQLRGQQGPLHGVLEGLWVEHIARARRLLTRASGTVAASRLRLRFLAIATCHDRMTCHHIMTCHKMMTCHDTTTCHFFPEGTVDGKLCVFCPEGFGGGELCPFFL